MVGKIAHSSCTISKSPDKIIKYVRRSMNLSAASSSCSRSCFFLLLFSLSKKVLYLCAAKKNKPMIGNHFASTVCAAELLSYFGQPNKPPTVGIIGILLVLPGYPLLWILLYDKYKYSNPFRQLAHDPMLTPSRVLTDGNVRRVPVCQSENRFLNLCIVTPFYCSRKVDGPDHEDFCMNS
jgi:hypothetical protein